MARGQSISIRCPCCGRPVGVCYLGQWRKRYYQHGHSTGLPDSYGQWLVRCLKCGHEWFSRHSDARHAAGFPEYYHETTNEQRGGQVP